jgi:hypothetical protein
MFLKNYRKNPPALLRIFALFGLAITFLCGAASIANAQTNKGTYLDFTGDGKTDWAVINVQLTSNYPFRWKILGNQTGSSAQTAPFIRVFDYGPIGDIAVPGDYTGDRKTDPTVWRPDPQGIFYVAQFPAGTDEIKLDLAVPWGIGHVDGAGSQGDYDGDGKMD